MSKKIEMVTSFDIYHGLKKRFVKLDRGDYYCVYDCFGGQEGTLIDILPCDDYKKASKFDILQNIEDLYNDISPHIKKIKNLNER